MPDPQTLALFVAATLAPDLGVLYVVACSAEGGHQLVSRPPWA